MLLQPIDYFLMGWFLLAGLSTLYVGINQYRNNPEPVVMKWGFILVTLYMGPIGLLLYASPTRSLALASMRPSSSRFGSKELDRPSIASPGMQPESSRRR